MVALNAVVVAAQCCIDLQTEISCRFTDLSVEYILYIQSHVLSIMTLENGMARFAVELVALHCSRNCVR